MTIINIERFEPTDDRLGRHVEHDERNRMYAVRVDPSLPVLMPSVRHHTNLPVLDQGNVGACTGFAETGLIGFDQYWSALTPEQQAVISGAPNQVGLAIYSKATQIDNIPGNYPPDDTGSSGPAAAKAATALGYVNGYRHAFSLGALNTALQKGPVMVGSNWYNSMFEPDPTGLIKIDSSSGLAGGHEYVCDEYDVDLDSYGFLNSWGTSYGINGRFYIKRTSFLTLLSASGDVTVPTPLSAPAPTPTPTPPPVVVDKDVLAAYKSLRAWAVRNGQV